MGGDVLDAIAVSTDGSNLGICKVPRYPKLTEFAGVLAPSLGGGR